MDRLAGLFYGDPDAQRAIAGILDEAVAIEVMGGSVGAVRQLCENGLDQSLAIGLRCAQDLHQCRGAVALGQAFDALDAAPVAGNLRLEVADAVLWHADVGEQHRPEFVVDDTGLDDLDRRQAQPFLDDFVGHRRAAGRGAADVRPVHPAGRKPASPRPSAKYSRLSIVMSGKMRAAASTGRWSSTASPRGPLLPAG